MHNKKWKSESCSKLKEILKISQKDDVVLEGKQTRSVLVLSGNRPFVRSQRDRCIFSYLETDQEAAVCWGSVSVQSQPDDGKNEKQHHDINSTVLMPLFISSAERDTEKTKEWLFNRRWQSDFCILRDLWEATRLAELGCRLDNFMLSYKFFFLYFIFFVQFFNQCWSCGRCREGQQANFKEPCAASPRVFDSSVQYRALFNIFSFQHKTHVQSKRKKNSAFSFFFFFFSLSATGGHFHSAVLMLAILQCENGPWDQSLPRKSLLACV